MVRLGEPAPKCAVPMRQGEPADLAYELSVPPEGIALDLLAECAVAFTLAVEAFYACFFRELRSSFEFVGSLPHPDVQ